MTLEIRLQERAGCDRKTVSHSQNNDEAYTARSDKLQFVACSYRALHCAVLSRQN